MLKWWFDTVIELLVLGCLVEVMRRPFIISGMGPVEKGDFDAVLRPNRLRLIVDHRAANVFILTPKFRMESLHRSRHLFEKGDVMLCFDEQAGFWSGVTCESHRELMGVMVQGRCFVWAANCMGTTSTPCLFQSMRWTVAKAFRRFGARLVQYLDDYVFVCHKTEAELLSKLILRVFRRLGILLSIKKCHPEPRSVAVVLGTQVDLDRMLFSVPADKRTKIVAECDALIAAYEASSRVRVRDVARSAAG